MMFKNRVLGKIFGSSGEEMKGRYRKLHFIRARKTLAEHVPGMWKRNAYRFLVAKTRREGLGVDTRRILQYI
jgi:hypothetical protein